MTTLARLRRAAWVLAGLLWFLWLGYEDRGTAAVQLLAVAICTATALQLLAGWLSGAVSGPGWRLLRFTAWGAAAGLGIGPVAALLMLVKLSLHAHDIPDFTATQIVAVMGATPWRAAQGAALGLAAGGLWLLSAQDGAPRSGTISRHG